MSLSWEFGSLEAILRGEAAAWGRSATPGLAAAAGVPVEFDGRSAIAGPGGLEAEYGDGESPGRSWALTALLDARRVR